MAAPTLLVAYLGLHVLLAAVALPDRPCLNTDVFPGWIIVAICVAAFGAGHVFSYLRFDHDVDVARRPKAGAALEQHVLNHQVGYKRFAQGALAFFLFSVALMLAYESIGLSEVGGLQPITLYIRCARTHDPVHTTLAAAAVTLLAGNWLWHRPRRVQEK